MSRWFGRGAKAGQAAPEAITLTLPQALWLAGSLCSLHHVPMAEALVAERLPPPITLGSVMALLAALGIRSQALRPGRLGDGLQPGTLVQLALNKDTAAAPADADADAAPALLLVLAVDGERVLVGALGQREPQRRNRAELLRDCSGLAYTTERSRSAVADPDAEPANGFGWAWFGQALLQHRRLWRDVLLTSLVIQLLALAVPLATQAVVDKVVVHRTQSSLRRWAWDWSRSPSSRRCCRGCARCWCCTPATASTRCRRPRSSRAWCGCRCVSSSTGPPAC